LVIIIGVKKGEIKKMVNTIEIKGKGINIKTTDQQLKKTAQTIKNGNLHILKGLTEQEIIHVINTNKAKKSKITNDIIDLALYKSLMQTKIKDLTESIGEEKVNELKEQYVDELLVKDYIFEIGDKKVNMVSYISKRITDLNDKIK
jgi:hypothetical protein